MAQQDVDTIDQQVLRLFAMVSEGLVRATEAFLDVDRDAARAEFSLATAAQSGSGEPTFR